MKNLLIIILIAFAAIVVYMLVKPSDKVEKVIISHDAVVQQVEELGQLELLKYSIRDIVEYEKVREWLPNSKTAIIVVGEVIACIDLQQINPDDVIVSGDSVSITLPMPEICHFKIDHSKSRVYDVQYGLWETTQLVDEAYREAEQQLKKQAQTMGIAEQSRESAVKLITPLLHNLGFKTINIDFKKSPSGNSELKFPRLSRAI